MKAAKKQLDNEPTLQLSMDQFRRLQKVWYAFGELADMIERHEAFMDECDLISSYGAQLELKLGIKIRQDIG